jgi:hypothetical protein
MKKVLLAVLFLFMALRVGASVNYTIAIVPYIQNAEDLKVPTPEQIYDQITKMEGLEVPDLTLKATNKVASIFSKYILPYIELNKQQKMSILIKMQTQIIKDNTEKLTAYYVKIANSNYQSIDIDKYNGYIDDVKKQIIVEQDKLERFVGENSEVTEFINTLDIQLPTNIKNKTSTVGDIKVKIIDDYKESFLLSNYTDEYRSYFLNKNDVNEIVFVEVDKIASLNNLKIYYENLSKLQELKDGEFYYDALDLIFDKIIANDSLSDLDPFILQALIHSFFPNLGIIKNEIPNANISVKEIVSTKILDKIQTIEDEGEISFTNDSVIYFDADKITSYDTVELKNALSYILLEEGTHYFLISGSGINSYVLKVESDNNKITSISTAGNPTKNGFLQLSSNVGKVNWIIDGVDFGFTNGLELDNQVIPSTILIKKTNFSDKFVELNEPSSKINISLNPPWMGEGAVFEKKQSDFYQGLLNYIIGCVTFISIKTINNIYGADNLKVIINNLNDGALILAQVNIVYQLVSYIKLATN